MARLSLPSELTALPVHEKFRTMHTPDPRNSSLFNSSLEKGLAVIRALGVQRREMNLPEIAEATGMSKSAAQRFAYSLEVMGYLRKDARSKRYALTPRCLELGFGYLQANWLIDHANPFLLDLNQKSGETVNLSEPDGTDMVFVARFPSHKHIAIHMPVGRRLPMFCTASGRAYLSALPDDVMARLIEASVVTQFTPSTVTDKKQLKGLIVEARTAGYAWANEEYFRGDINLAAPLVGAHGEVLGAINISLPTSRWTLDSGKRQLAQVLIETARAIGTSPPR